MIRKIDNKGIIAAATGTGSTGHSGDGGLAIEAELDQPIGMFIDDSAFNTPLGICLDSADSVYVTDTNNHCIRRIDAFGNITTTAGTQQAGFSGDAGPAAAAMLNRPWGIGMDESGNLYFADSGNNRIRKLTKVK